MKNKKNMRKIFPALLVAGMISLIYISGIFIQAANSLDDLLYQQKGTPPEDIIIIGMDDKATEAFGSMPWSRDIMASAIAYLNSDPNNAPAVIGVDATYIGNSNEAADKALVDAASILPNVIMASTASFGEVLVTEDDGSFYMDDYAVTAYEEPYAALLEVTKQGHVNAMYDDDGILRHAIWQIDLPDGREIPAFHRVIYESYLEYTGGGEALAPPTDARYHWYLPFQAAPFAFSDDYSIVDLVYGTLDPSAFADKIVLIGPYAQGMQDDYPTAIDHAIKMYGVEYQANAIAALLAQDHKYEVRTSTQVVILFIITFLAMLWFDNRKPTTATWVWAVGLLGYVAACYGLYTLGVVVDVMYIPIALTVCYLWSIIINYTRETLERRRVTRTFARYIAPEIVKELLKEDSESLELGGKLVDIAVLFVDIRGFTAMSEVLDAPKVVDIVNRYLELTSRCIFENGGTLDKYVGDCTMAFWGAPLKQEDSIFKAVKAAIDMVEGEKSLGEKLKKTFGRSVGFGIGVHYGPAVVGNVGSKMRMDYTAIGDTVNTAARLESNAPAGGIFVSRTVADALEGRVAFTSLGTSIKLKGKSDDFEVLKVEGLI